MSSNGNFRKLISRALLGAVLMIAAPARSNAAVFVGISVGIAPPPLPVYVQPPLPAEGYIWTPGYWAYAQDGGYYWVPGVWVEPPTVGYLWTPPYWGYAGGVYGFYPGYWGPHVGFYGGVNYGFGYFGSGFGGGLWVGNRFSYNSAVNNFGGVHVTNVYVNREVIVAGGGHASFNGPGGYQAHASAQEQQWSHENHVQATAAQQQHFETARTSPQQHFSANGGRPGTVAASTPAAFHQQAAARSGFGQANGGGARPGAAGGEQRGGEQRPNNLNNGGERPGGNAGGQQRPEQQHAAPQRQPQEHPREGGGKNPH